MEELSNFFENTFEYLRNHPGLGGLVIAGIALIMLIAIIMDADWMLEGGNGFFNIATISKMFGRNTARIIMAIPCVVLIIIGLFTAWVY